VVSAQVRLCDRASFRQPWCGVAIPTPARCGNQPLRGGVTVYAGQHDGDGRLDPRHGPNPVPRPRPTPISPAASRDPDVWVLEIEDRKGQYH
jgi:hypothetical protein